MARAERLCVVCEWQSVWARDRCHTCLKYLIRHGIDRPEALVVAHGQAVLERRLARNVAQVNDNRGIRSC